MERAELQRWILEAASKATQQAATERLVAPFHFDVYLDNQAGGRLCSFEIAEGGKLLWFNFNGDVPERAEYPMKLKLESADGQWRGAVIRERSWDLWRVVTRV